MTPGFHHVPVLAAAKAAEVASRVVDLRDRWERRNDTGLYHTIGVVAEEDAHAGVDDYCRRAEPSNVILKQTFSDVLERIRTALQETRGEPVRLHQRYGLPGVMIYLSPNRPAVVVGNRPHVDLQYRLLDWPPGFEPVSENLLSFTLALALPSRGAGLRIWPELRDRLLPGVPLTSSNATFISYEVGQMLCHDGLTPHHGVGMRTDGEREERRITIQGFGVRVNREWLLYW